MVIADIAVVPLRPLELGCERVITTVRIDEKAGGITIDEKLKNHR